MNIKKLTLISIISTGIITNSLGVDKYPFFGISINSADINDDRINTIGLRYGQQTQDWRTTFTLEHREHGRQSLIVQMDKTLLHSIGTSKLRAYTGLAIGAMSQQRSDKDSKDIGYVYGATVGMMYYVSDTIDLDLSYRYLKTDDNIDSVNDFNSATLGIHYFF
jgi:opacity protein-like surface antigen